MKRFMIAATVISFMAGPAFAVSTCLFDERNHHLSSLQNAMEGYDKTMQELRDWSWKGAITYGQFSDIAKKEHEQVAEEYLEVAKWHANALAECQR